MTIAPYTIKPTDDIALLMESGRINTLILGDLVAKSKAGMSLFALNAYAERIIAKFPWTRAVFPHIENDDGDPFPGVVTLSVNDEAAHGTPRRDIVLADGDVLKIDLGVAYRTMITDAAVTVVVGGASNAVTNLVSYT